MKMNDNLTVPAKSHILDLRLGGTVKKNIVVKGNVFWWDLVKNDLIG